MLQIKKNLPLKYCYVLDCSSMTEHFEALGLIPNKKEKIINK